MFSTTTMTTNQPTTTTTTKRPVSTSSLVQEIPIPESTNVMKEEEKTIPFLRRLVDMLSENDEVISFYPGIVKNGNVELGRIVVHDRLKVESQVLPRYFNHSSFASLRRQLNYFSFTRMGKGRQRGATYCNEGVVELEDILRLKRRSSVGGGSSNNGIRDGSTTIASQPTLHPSTTSSSQQVIHPNGDYSENHVRVKRSRYNNNGSTSKHTPTAIVSPRSSPVHQSIGGSSSSGSDSEQQITLDLTVPSTSTTFHQDSFYHRQHHGSYTNKRKWGSMSYISQQIPHGDEDILAGCNALLSFSKGLHRSTTV